MALARTQKKKAVNVGCWDISHMTVDIGEILNIVQLVHFR